MSAATMTTTTTTATMMLFLFIVPPCKSNTPSSTIDPLSIFYVELEHRLPDWERIPLLRKNSALQLQTILFIILLLYLEIFRYDLFAAGASLSADYALTAG